MPYVSCPKCGGKGWIMCPRCHGTGEQMDIVSIKPCERCEGSPYGKGKVKCPFGCREGFIKEGK